MIIHRKNVFVATYVTRRIVVFLIKKNYTNYELCSRTHSIHSVFYYPDILFLFGRVLGIIHIKVYEMRASKIKLIKQNKLYLKIILIIVLLIYVHMCCWAYILICNICKLL